MFNPNHGVSLSVMPKSCRALRMNYTCANPFLVGGSNTHPHPSARAPEPDGFLGDRAAASTLDWAGLGEAPRGPRAPDAGCSHGGCVEEGERMEVTVVLWRPPLPHPWVETLNRRGWGASATLGGDGRKVGCFAGGLGTRAGQGNPGKTGWLSCARWLVGLR